MKSIRIEIPMIPQTKPATSFAVVGGHVRTWNKSSPMKKWLQDYLRNEVKEKNIEVVTDPKMPLVVNISYFLPVPKSVPAWKRNLMMWGIEPHVSKPDRDNLAKFHNDAGTGVLWPDDRQIVDGRLFKRFSETPKVVYEIEEFKNPHSAEQIEMCKLFSPKELFLILSDAWEPVSDREEVYYCDVTLMQEICDGERAINAELMKEFGSRLKKLDKILTKLHDVE